MGKSKDQEEKGVGMKFHLSHSFHLLILNRDLATQYLISLSNYLLFYSK